MAGNDPKFEQLKQKYQSVMSLMSQQQVHLQNVNMEGDKLFVRAEAPSQEIKNKIWDQIKLVDPKYSDLAADITVNAPAVQTSGAAAGSAHSAQSYTVQAGDSLSKISKQFYGSANQYMKIFEANRDQLSDPNKIMPGQKLTIPQ